jgi:hypothetical protein
MGGQGPGPGVDGCVRNVAGDMKRGRAAWEFQHQEKTRKFEAEPRALVSAPLALFL